MEFCKKHGAFDPKTMGACPNVGLMAQKASGFFVCGSGVVFSCGPSERTSLPLSALLGSFMLSKQQAVSLRGVPNLAKNRGSRKSAQKGRASLCDFQRCFSPVISHVEFGRDVGGSANVPQK